MTTARLALIALLLSAAVTRADVLEANPGAGTIAPLAAKARDGDTIRLKAGEYTGSVELPEGVTLEGAGADQTILVGTAHAAVNCAGPRVKITGLCIKSGEGTIRGVTSRTPVRVERCRFDGVKEAVALMTAPLSDVVACEFINCGIGVRAIGEACPTIWGCSFKGGGMGVFAMDGMPYIRNNVFSGQRAGLRMALGSQQAIVRNNLFLDCKDAGIELMGASAFGPAIRNNIFGRCGAAITGEADLLRNTSHFLVFGVQAPAFRDKAGAMALEAPAAGADPGIDMGPDGTLVIANQQIVENKGIRASGDPEGHAAWIGPERAWWRAGPAAAGELPPVRFNEGALLANAVREEYQYLQLRGVRLCRQATGRENGRQYDTMSCVDQGNPVELKFDITRFFGEMSIKP